MTRIAFRECSAALNPVIAKALPPAPIFRKSLRPTVVAREPNSKFFIVVLLCSSSASLLNYNLEILIDSRRKYALNTRRAVFPVTNARHEIPIQIRYDAVSFPAQFTVGRAILPSDL